MAPLRRISVGAGDVGNTALKVADEAAAQRDACMACDKALRLPIGGTPSVSTSNEEVQVDFLFLGGFVTVRARGLFSGYSPCAVFFVKSFGSPGRQERPLDFCFRQALLFPDECSR